MMSRFPLPAVLAGMIVLAPAAASAQQTAPTAAASPAELDRQWQESVTKYAPRRAELLGRVDEMGGKGPFRPDWTSLKTYQAPQWYRDAKFGIFIHWGLYSVPAFGSEWYSRNSYDPKFKDFQHHIATYGPQDKFGYKDLIPLFKAEKFDPKQWAALFHAAGARYVVPVAEHHDGFSMYDSRLSDWTAVKMGPKRDLVGELAGAVRAEGLHFGLSSHRAEHDWFFDNGRKIASDVNDPAYASFYGPAQMRLPGKTDEDLMGDFTPVSQAWLDDWLARSTELVETYHPDLVYFDWWIGQPAFRNTLPRFLAYYYNEQAAHGGAGVMNYKLGSVAEGAAVLDIERGQQPGIQPEVWQTCTSISNASWGYVENDTYKSPSSLINMLADIVSKNGNLLLNIGPRADGSIPEPAQISLRAMGSWLKANGEAIYGTRPWRVYGEGPTAVASGTFSEKNGQPYTARDFRFTARDGALYAIELGWPADGKAVIHSVTGADHVRAVTLLADGSAVKFTQYPDGLHLELPKNKTGDYAAAYRIDL